MESTVRSSSSRVQTGLLAVLVCFLLTTSSPAQVRSGQLIRVYVEARELAAQGQIQEAIRLLQNNIVYQSRFSDDEATVRETNARLLALMAELLHKNASNEKELFKSESYAAWAINTSRCELTYWKLYVTIRLEREHYAPFVGAARRGESLRYPLRADTPGSANSGSFSPPVQRQRSAPADDELPFPNKEDGPLLESLLYIQNGETDRAAPLLAAYHEHPNFCPITDLIGEIALRAGDPKTALEYLIGSVKAEHSFMGPSAYRMFLYGQAQRATGDLDGARRSFTESLRIDDSVTDAEAALHEIASGQTADPQVQEAYLNRNPDNWQAWSALWGSEYLRAQPNILEFANFARSKEKEPGLVAPKLAQGLVALYFHDFSGALDHVAEASRINNTGDVVFASLVTHLLRGEYAAAASDSGSLPGISPSITERLRPLGCCRVEALEINRLKSASEQKLRTGAVLLSLAQAFPENAYAQIAIKVFLLDLGPEAGSADMRVDILLANQVAEGQTSEQRYVRSQQQYAAIRADMKDYQLHLKRVESDVRDLHLQLASSEDRMTSMIETRDAKMAAQLDRLADSIQVLRASMRGQAGDLGVLADWRSASPRQVAHEIVTLSDLLSMMASAVSFGPRIGEVQFNVVGILAGILEIAGA
jgi:hypothetical protein